MPHEQQKSNAVPARNGVVSLISVRSVHVLDDGITKL